MKVVLLVSVLMFFTIPTVVYADEWIHGIKGTTYIGMEVTSGVNVKCVGVDTTYERTKQSNDMGLYVHIDYPYDDYGLPVTGTQYKLQGTKGTAYSPWYDVKHYHDEMTQQDIYLTDFGNPEGGGE